MLEYILYTIAVTKYNIPIIYNDYEYCISLYVLILSNNTGGAIDLAAATSYCLVIKKS